MYVDPLLPLLALGPKKYRAWPKALTPGRITYHPLSWLLTQSHEGDAHVAAYSVPSVLHRLGTDPPAYARVEGGVPMVVFLLDIDCASAHRATGGSGAVHADDAWWSILRRRIEALDAVHPGAFAYRTRGGARLIYRPVVPMVIENSLGEIAWKRLYLACLVYLARRFSIVADPSISDWPRLIRLPHVTRDGVFQRAETLGDPFSVGVLDFGDDGEGEGALEFVRRLAANTKVWAPALRILARNALPPERRARVARVIEHRDVDVGAWSALASDLGRALTRHHGRHGVHLALAGACFDRGLPLDMAQVFATAICRASGETDDRPQVWQTTADRMRAGQLVTGYGHLAAHWPDLAALIDTALPSGGGAQAVRDELDARGTPDAIVAGEASSTLRTALVSPPPGLSLLRVTEGAGKTRTAIEVLRERALAVGDRRDVPSSMKSVYVAPTHRVAAEVAEALRGVRGEYVRSVLAAGGCAYHVPLGRVTAARHAVQTWCEGWGMGYKGAPKPCDKLDGCPARAGAVVPLGGAGSPAVLVTVHALLQQALDWAGSGALVLLDEDPDAIEALTLTREELETAASAEVDFALSERFRGPVLRALAVGLERGDLPTENPLRVVFERGAAALADDTAWTTQVTQEYGTTDTAEILRAYAWRVAWSEYKDSKGTTIRRRSAWAPRPSKRSHGAVIAGTMSERFTAASLTHATVARLVAGVVQEKAPNGAEHAERAVAAVEVAPGDGSHRVLRAVIASPAVAYAMRNRGGPTVLLDATADVSIVHALAQGAVPVTDVRVRDGAPIGRRLLFWSGASRKHVLGESGDVRWDEGLERYLRAALAQVVERGARRIGLFTWKPLADLLRAGTDPIARALLDELVALGVTLTVGHYGDARSRNDWADCHALVSIGDPKPNVGASRAIAAVLGLSAEHDAVYRRATAAELSQVAGRLRAPWRTVGALHVHVGTIAPASWDRRAEVLELPKGVTSEVDSAAAAEAVHVYGSKRLAAAAIRVSERTIQRTLANAGNVYPEDSHTRCHVTPSGNNKTVAPVTVCDTLKTQRFSVPSPPVDAAALIDRAGGAPAVASLLGVGRATVYHWRSGARPMPADARQRLLEALAAPAVPEPPPVTFAPPVAAAMAPASREWFIVHEVTDATA